MEQDELLRHVVGTLESLDLPYLITGSMATILYGEPRFTNDIDVVVQLPASRIDALVEWADRLGLREIWDRVVDQV